MNFVSIWNINIIVLTNYSYNNAVEKRLSWVNLIGYNRAATQSYHLFFILLWVTSLNSLSFWVFFFPILNCCSPASPGAPLLGLSAGKVKLLKSPSLGESRTPTVKFSKWPFTLSTKEQMLTPASFHVLNLHLYSNGFFLSGNKNFLYLNSKGML